MHLNFTGLIPIVVGIYVLLLVFRVIPLGKNPEANDQWLRKFGPMMKVFCPILILYGLGQFFGLLR